MGLHRGLNVLHGGVTLLRGLLDGDGPFGRPRLGIIQSGGERMDPFGEKVQVDANVLQLLQFTNHQNFWDVCPEYFRNSRDKMSKHTDYVHMFLTVGPEGNSWAN